VNESAHIATPGRRSAGRASRAGIAVAFFGSLLLLGAIALYGARENLAAREARSWVTHTYDVLGTTLRLENAVLLMEARHRAYLVGGDDEFVRRRDASHAEALAQGRELATAMADNPAQRQRLLRAEEAIAQRYATMRDQSALAQAAGLDAARAQFHAFGSGSIDPVRDALGAVRDAEQRLLQARRAESERRAARMDRVLVYGTAAAVVALLAAGWALGRQIRRSESMGLRLAQTSALQQAMLDSGGVMIISVHPDGRIRLFNRAASEALGYRPEELIDRHTPAIFHDAVEIEARAAELSAELGEPVEGFAAFTARPDRGQVERGEWTYVRKDGSRFPVELAVAALRGADGGVLGYIGMALDQTERRAAERAVRGLNRELEAKAAALAAANRELEGFSYSVSHDLRAPLRHIEGYARMLQEDAAGALAPEWQRYLDSISGSARRMGALIDDLLAFSRLGRSALQNQRVDMESLARDVLRELAPERATVSIANLPAVSGDAGLLRQVWTNLISNAIKYSAPRGEQARIEVDGALERDLASFEVRDNGVGFDMRYRAKLFGVFQRLHSQDQFEGTGVGLAIVDRIVRRHGGRVDASAEPGRGAVFRFELPLACAQPAPEPVCEEG
jgi:PAS domain S-box-containing protein